MALGISVLLGWLLEAPVLKGLLPGAVAMNPLTAIGFLLLGGALWRLRRESPGPGDRRWGMGLAGAVMILAGIVLVAYAFGWTPIVDQTLFREQVLRTVPPNRMAPNTALNFLLIGSGLLILGTSSRVALLKLMQLLALTAGVVAFLPVLGHLYQSATFTRVGASFIPMALNTALGFLILALGLLGARPDQGFMSLFCSEHLGGRVLRRLLPVIFLAPILMGWIRLWAERVWGYDTPFGVGFMVTGVLLVTTCLLWWNAGMLEKVETALIDSETKLRTIVETSPELIAIRDREGRYLMANPAVAKLLGRPVAEILGRRDADFFGPESLRRIEERNREVLESDSPRTYEIAVTPPGGGNRVFLSSKYPYHDPGGELVGVISISRDVTELKKIELALRESQQRIKVVLDNSPVFLFSVDSAGRVLLAKGKGLQALALDAADLAGKDIAEAFAAFPEFGAAYRRALSGESFRISVDSRGTSFDVWFTPVRGDLGARIVGVIGIATDVSERKQLEAQLRAQYEKLRELDKLKGDFVNAVSHDLRTPLTSIRGYAEFLEDEIGGPLTEVQRGFVAQVLKSATRLEGMVSDLLDIARLDAGTFRLHCEETNLTGKIAEMVESFKPQADEHDLELQASLPEEPVLMVLDPQRIERVLANLIGNAIKFTPDGGRLMVRAKVEPDAVLCEVSDTGIGIAPEDLPKLFQRFSQLEAGARKKSGTGLGLSISKAQVEAHGGRIGVRSELGKGSTFWFRLPKEVPAQCRVDGAPA